VELTTEREARTSEYSALMAKVLESESYITTVSAEIANLKGRLAKEPYELVEMTTKENPGLVKLRDKLDELNFHRMDLLRDFNPESRQVQDLNEQVARVRQQLKAEPE